MPSPVSIAWQPSWNPRIVGSDEIWIVTTNSAGAIIGWTAVVPDPVPVTGALQWGVQVIAPPGSASVPTAAGEAPAIAFGHMLSPFQPPTTFPLTIVLVAAGGPNGVVCYRTPVPEPGRPRPQPEWTGQSVPGATGRVVGMTVMPDDQAYILTVSSSQELIGWLGDWLGFQFVQMPILAPGTTIPAPAVVAAMAVRSVNSSQIEVHVVAGQQLGPSTSSELTYFWSTYTVGSFEPWQSNQISMPSIPGATAVYPSWPVSIALGPNPNGEVIVTAPVEVKSGPLNKSYVYYFVANSPGSTWTPVPIPLSGDELSPGGVAVDANGTAHSLIISSFIGRALSNAPELTDYTLAQGVLGSNPVDSPGGSYTTDPLDWNDVTWKGSTYSLPGGPTTPYALDIVPGMTVRASGEVDVAFWNFPWKSVALFSLPLASNQWKYDLIGYPDQ